MSLIFSKMDWTGDYHAKYDKPNSESWLSCFLSCAESKNYVSIYTYDLNRIELCGENKRPKGGKKQEERLFMEDSLSHLSQVLKNDGRSSSLNHINLAVALI